MSTDQIAYATQASEAAFVVSYAQNGSKEEIKLEILKDNYEHSDSNMYVVFHINEAEKLFRIISPLKSGKYDVSVEFEVKHFYFNSLVKAVNKITPMIIKRILPNRKSFLPLDIVHGKQVSPLLKELSHLVRVDDEDQYKTLETILSCKRKSPPIIVSGAFGTGKTQVLAIATYCLIRHGQKSLEPVRVLICAHHQASADHFIEKYFGPMFKTNAVKLIRLTSKSYSVRNSKFHQYYMNIDNYVYHNDPHLVIVTTFLTAPSLQRKFHGNTIFTHILMDEGSQSREPEAIAPLSLAGSETKLVIAGDSCQVNITISYRW